MSLGRRHAVCPIIFAATPILNWPSAHSLSGSLGLGDTPFTPMSWLRTLPSLILLQSKCPSVPRATGFCHEHQDWGAPGFAPCSLGCRAAFGPAYSAACLGAYVTCRGKEYHSLVPRLGMDTRGHWKSSPGNTLVPTASPRSAADPVTGESPSLWGEEEAELCLLCGPHCPLSHSAGSHLPSDQGRQEPRRDRCCWMIDVMSLGHLQVSSVAPAIPAPSTLGQAPRCCSGCSPAREP